LLDPDSTPGNRDPDEDDRAAVTIRPRRGRQLDAGRSIASSSVTGFLIPLTGFAPGLKTELNSVPNTRFDPTLLSIEIPTLSVDIPIVGVPYKDHAWDINWLSDQAGWLQGTAYPTFSGDSVLTGHLVTADGKPGPFYNLRQLKVGESIIVDNGSFHYVYTVLTKRWVHPEDESILDHTETAWLTLVTCDSYDIETRTYLRRLVVRAKLVKVLPST
jgi:LPXTG-site transpeptidase (sortase) family protein